MPQMYSIMYIAGAAFILNRTSCFNWRTLGDHWTQDFARNQKTNHKIVLISHASKVLLKFLQARLQQYVNCELQMFKLVLEKAEEPEINCQYLLDYQKSKRVPEKHLLLLYWLCQSLWLCGSQQTEENSSRDRTTRPPYLTPEKSSFSGRNKSWNNS